MMYYVRGGIFFVLLVCVFQADGAPRSVTNEDIRDAILSMVNVIRSTEDKLERHEFREKTLGDQVKRVLSNIDKRQKQLDSVRGTISRLDQRLATVETILLQKDERERIQVQKVFDMVEQIHRSLPQLFETLKNDITSSFSSNEEKPQDAPHNVEIEKLQKEIATKIDDTSSTVKNIEGQLSQIREENKNNFSGAHKFMEQYDNKLDKYNKHIDVLPTRCKQETDLQTNVILKALENQELYIKKLQAEVSGANSTIRELQHKMATIHGNLESDQKDVKNNLKELMKDSKQNYKNYDSQLGAYKEKIDAMPATYKNESEAQTKELLKAFQTHDANLKQLKKELNDLNTKAKILPEQNVKIIDKLDLLPKLMNNDNLLLNQSEIVQNALQKMETKINDQLRKIGEETPKIKDEISKALDLELPKKIDAAEENIKKKLLELQKAADQHLTECIDEVPKKQKQHTDEILKVLNHELPKKFEAAIQNQRQQGDEIVKVLSREMDRATTNVSADIKSYANESRTQRNLILEALKVQRDQLQACGNHTELLKKDLQMHTNILQRDNLITSETLSKLADSVDQTRSQNQASAEALLVQLNDTRSSALENLQLITSNSNFRWDAIETLIEHATEVSMTIKEGVGTSEKSLIGKMDDIKRDLKSHSDEVKEAFIESKTILQRHESELVDYNDKMDALPWKHKVENDKQTQMLLEALKQHIDSATIDSRLRCDEALFNEKEHTKNQTNALKEMNGTVTAVVELLKRQPKQNELVQTIEKQMLFIATTAATNINDRLERITSSQLEQFTNRMDAFVLGQKVDNTQWHEAIMQECASQSSVAAIEGALRNLSSDTTLSQFIKKAVDDAKERTKDQEGKLDEILTKLEMKALDSTIMEALKSHSRNFTSGLDSVKTNIHNDLEEASLKWQKIQRDGDDTRIKELQQLMEAHVQSGYNRISETVERKFNESIDKTNELPLRIKMEVGEQSSIIFQAIKTQVLTTEKLQTTLTTNLQNISGDINQAVSGVAEIETKLKAIEEKQSDCLDELKAKLENVTSRGRQADLAVYRSEIEIQTTIILKALEVHTKQVKKLEKHIENKTLSTNDLLETMQTHLAKIHDNTQKHGDAAEAIRKNISSNNELLQKFNSKLEDDREGCRKLLENHTISTLEFQKEINEKLGENAKTLKNADEHYENLTQLLHKAANKTQGLCPQVECNSSSVLSEIKAIRGSLEDLRSKSDTAKLLESIKTVEELSENLNTNIALSFGKLIDEINNLQKLEEAVRQTGDGVIDTKRRVEYGVHQVSTEVSNLIKTQTKELITALNARFNNLETSLLDNDEGILVNLTTTMAQEVDQVWKQIGMMHQKMTATNGLISTLESRTDRFVNSTTAAMDSMKGNIGINTAHVIDMGNNLNNLFGRISLITQEFNLIKKGLGNTLDEMKRGCQTVQNRMKPETGAGVGPYPINRT